MAKRQAPLLAFWVLDFLLASLWLSPNTHQKKVHHVEKLPACILCLGLRQNGLEVPEDETIPEDKWTRTAKLRATTEQGGMPMTRSSFYAAGAYGSKSGDSKNGVFSLFLTPLKRAPANAHTHVYGPYVSYCVIVNKDLAGDW